MRDLNRKDWRVIQRAAELVGVDGRLVGAIDARVFMVAVQEELGCAEVSRCPQVAVTCAHAMTGGPLRFRFGENPLGRGIPFVVPAVVVAGGYATDGGHDLAELTGPVAGSTEGPLGFEPELFVVGEEGVFRGCG
jgi:hypothetical protein